MNKKIAVLVTGLLLLGMAGMANATLVDFSFWSTNGDSVNINGITVSLSGSNIESFSTLIANPLEGETSVIFDFDQNITSIDFKFVSMDGPFDIVNSFNIAPSSISGTNLVGIGVPITSVEGATTGTNPWDGTLSFTSMDTNHLEFTMMSLSGSNSRFFIKEFDNLQAANAAAPVPEPSTMLLLGSGLLGLIGYNYHRQKQVV